MTKKSLLLYIIKLLCNLSSTSSPSLNLDSHFVKPFEIEEITYLKLISENKNSGSKREPVSLSKNLRHACLRSAKSKQVPDAAQYLIGV